MRQGIIQHQLSTHFLRSWICRIPREFFTQKFRWIESKMNNITFEKLKRMNKQCNACVKAYALFILLSLMSFFIYFFNYFTIEMLFTDNNALLPVIKIEALVLGIMHIIYSLFFKYMDKKLKIYGLDSNNLNEYINQNQGFFQKY